MVIFPVLLSFSFPLILLLVERFFPYPHIMEELAKLIVVLWIVKIEKEQGKGYLNWVLGAGIFFALSEEGFYMTNILMIGKMTLFFQRLVFLTIIHAGTFLVLYFFSKEGGLKIALGLILAILIHYFYNSYWQF